MSIASAKAFYQRMSQDDAFRMPFEAASTKEERQQLIENSGYDFTADEWQTAISDIQADNADGELSEAALEAIAGGRGIVPIYGVVRPGDIFDSLR